MPRFGPWRFDGGDALSLDDGDFRLLVAGFEPAERGHGGEGAFYVRVRRRA